MSMSLKDLKSTTATLPPRGLIYGPAGMGKTTLAAEFPNAVLIPVEEGVPADISVTAFPQPKSFEDVMSALAALYTDEHEFGTVIIDGIDKFEALVWREVCEEKNWESIESPGYGKGYVEADSKWREFLEACNALRRERGMAVLLISHAEIVRFDDPRTVSYSRYDFRLHKRAHALIEDEMDMILFLNQDAAIKEEDQGFNKKRARADGALTWIYTQGRPSMNAKNRYGIPQKVAFKKGAGFKSLAPYFPGGNGEAVAEAEAQEGEAPEAEAKPNKGAAKKAA